MDPSLAHCMSVHCLVQLSPGSDCWGAAAAAQADLFPHVCCQVEGLWRAHARLALLVQGCVSGEEVNGAFEAVESGLGAWCAGPVVWRLRDWGGVRAAAGLLEACEAPGWLCSSLAGPELPDLWGWGTVRRGDGAQGWTVWQMVYGRLWRHHCPCGWQVACAQAKQGLGCCETACADCGCGALCPAGLQKGCRIFAWFGQGCGCCVSRLCGAGETLPSSCPHLACRGGGLRGEERLGVACVALLSSKQSLARPCCCR